MTGSKSLVPSPVKLTMLNRWYNIATATYVIVMAHYLSELLIFRTTKLNSGFLSPTIVGSASKKKARD
jgi:hypothetical protein